VSLPPSTPQRFVVPARPAAGVDTATPVIAAGRFDHDAREAEDTYAHLVYRVADGDDTHARALGAVLRDALATNLDLATIDRIVLVPTHDGATSPAMRAVADQLGPPHRQAIERRHPTAPNKTIADDDQRWANVADTVAATTAVPGEAILLVDDILGSGASMATAAAALRAAGATRVQAAVLGVRVPSPFELTPVDDGSSQRTN